MIDRKEKSELTDGDVERITTSDIAYAYELAATWLEEAAEGRVPLESLRDTAKSFRKMAGKDVSKEYRLLWGIYCGAWKILPGNNKFIKSVGKKSLLKDIPEYRKFLDELEK